MAGKGPAPKTTGRRNRSTPLRGAWKPTVGVGWQHDPIPDAPDGLLPATRSAWTTWMGAWFAAHWTPDDLPGLRRVALLYDLCERFSDDPYVEKITAKEDSVFVLRPNPASECRQMMDNYGITPKGQQDRRWVRAKDEIQPTAATPASPYKHLRVVNE